MLQRRRCVWRRNNAIARAHSQPGQSLIDSTVFRGFSATSQLFLPCVYCCFLVSQSPAEPAEEQDDKKRSTFQRALARVSRVSSLHSGLAGCFICLPCPALPCHRPRNANVHVKPQQGPWSCRATLFPCPTSTRIFIITVGMYLLPALCAPSPKYPYPPVGRCQRMCQPKWPSPFKTSCRACRACRALVQPPHIHSRPTPPMGPSRITRKLSAAQGEKEVSE